MTKAPTLPWMENLDQFHGVIGEATLKEQGELRFGSRFVKVSDLAGQYYCEKKIELVWLQGEEESQEMTVGREAHEELQKDSIKEKRETVWKRIFDGEPVVIGEMLLAAKHDGSIIVGMADAVCFNKARPVLLLEHKFSRRPAPYQDHHVQARLYCYLLQLMGFDVSQLRYALVMAPPECKGSDDLRRIPTLALKHQSQEPMAVSLPNGTANVYLTTYRQSEILGELEWALGFWKNQRDPKPTSNAGKCRVCQFRETCEFSLARTPTKP